jgi:hypothetical protein
MTTKSLRPPSFSTGSSARSQTKASSNTPVNSRGSGRLPTTATRSTRMGRRMHGVACRPEQDEVNRGAPPRRLPTGASFEQRTCWCPFASLRSGTGPGAELNMKRGNFPFSRVGPTVRIRFPPGQSPVRTSSNELSSGVDRRWAMRRALYRSRSVGAVSLSCTRTVGRSLTRHVKPYLSGEMRTRLQDSWPRTYKMDI